MNHAITTQKEIRTEFWRSHPQFKRIPGWTQNQYKTDIRTAYCNFVDALQRNGDISEALANRATL